MSWPTISSQSRRDGKINQMGGWEKAESAERQPAGPLSPLEIEVLRRELGVAASGRIAALAAAPGLRQDHGCARTIELLDAMARLHGPQRRLAVRLMLH